MTRGGFNKGIRTKFNGGTIEFRWTGVLVLSGFPKDELLLRANMRRRLERALENCERFVTAGLPRRVSGPIVAAARFRATGGPSYWQIKHLDVHYCNPPSHWKWWLRIVDGQPDTRFNPGDPV